VTLRWLLTIFLAAVILALVVEGFGRKGKIYQFPFLAGVMALTFVLPQLPGLANDSFLPQGAYTKTMIMTILCMVALRLGWASTSKPAEIFRWTFSERKLLIVAAVLSLAGSYFYIKLSHLPGDLVIGVQMSGISVVYIFFARLLTYGLVIAVMCFVRRPSVVAALLIAFDLIFYFDRIVVTGKRGEAMELILIFCLAVWFHYRWALPRMLVFVGIFVGMLAMLGMADYRQITRETNEAALGDVSSIDFAGNLETILEKGGPEMRNAVLRIHMTDATKQFDYGKVHWNRLVWDFFPAQVFGAAMKQSLMLQTPSPGRIYQPPTGSTETGMADAFGSFWYFGCLKFFLLAYLLKRIWSSAMRGDELGQIVFALSVVPGVHAISHQSDWVLAVWVQMLFFLMPMLVLAMASPTPAEYRRPEPTGKPAFAAPPTWRQNRLAVRR